MRAATSRRRDDSLKSGTSAPGRLGLPGTWLGGRFWPTSRAWWRGRSGGPDRTGSQGVRGSNPLSSTLAPKPRYLSSCRSGGVSSLGVDLVVAVGVAVSRAKWSKSGARRRWPRNGVTVCSRPTAQYAPVRCLSATVGDRLWGRRRGRTRLDGGSSSGHHCGGAGLVRWPQDASAGGWSPCWRSSAVLRTWTGCPASTPVLPRRRSCVAGVGRGGRGCRRTAVQGVAAPGSRPDGGRITDGGGGPRADVGGSSVAGRRPGRGSNRCPRGSTYSIYKRPRPRWVGDLCTVGCRSPSPASLTHDEHPGRDHAESVAATRSAWARRSLCVRFAGPATCASAACDPGTGMTVTPSEVIGSPNTRLAVSESCAWAMALVNHGRGRHRRQCRLPVRRLANGACSWWDCDDRGRPCRDDPAPPGVPIRVPRSWFRLGAPRAGASGAGRRGHIDRPARHDGVVDPARRRCRCPILKRVEPTRGPARGMSAGRRSARPSGCWPAPGEGGLPRGCPARGRGFAWAGRACRPVLGTVGNTWCTGRCARGPSSGRRCHRFRRTC